MNNVNRIVELVKQDTLRLKALDCVALLDLSEGYIAAGFVRNLVWDALHHKSEPTPLNDIDVIYFDSTNVGNHVDLEYETTLKGMMPNVNWQVRNQAMMHHRNHDNPYVSVVDAMRYWPEKETAVAIRKKADGELECISAFGLDSLFALEVTHNPKRNKEVFEYRVHSKAWLKTWPNLKVLT